MSQLGNGTLGDGELSVQVVTATAGKTNFAFTPVTGQATGKATGTGQKTSFVFTPETAEGTLFSDAPINLNKPLRFNSSNKAKEFRPKE